MNFQAYKQLIKEIQIGKHLPVAIYLHKSAIDSLPIVLQNFLQKTIKDLDLSNASWNLIKFSKKDFKISLLCYPTFFQDSYPPLHSSNTIDLEKGSVRKSSYKKSTNPPILHRKETFLKPDHPSVQLFREITKEGEEAGLYKNTRTIGFKKSWERLIAQNGLMLVEGRLQKKKQRQTSTSPETKTTDPIQRHRTAIDRNKLSAPMQSLLRHNYLQGQHVIFDYGCGKADDLSILRENGIEASGWDPVYQPDEQKKSSDIVNLGFVINVIENQQERKTTLQQAYKLANKILVISAMLGGESITSQYKKYGDGVVTSRNTFQKYYTQKELKDFIASALNEEPVAVGPGIFYVFKDEIEEQNFLVQRQTSKKTWLRLSYSDHPEKLKIKRIRLDFVRNEPKSNLIRWVSD